MEKERWRIRMTRKQFKKILSGKALKQNIIKNVIKGLNTPKTWDKWR